MPVEPERMFPASPDEGIFRDLDDAQLIAERQRIRTEMVDLCERYFALDDELQRRISLN